LAQKGAFIKRGRVPPKEQPSSPVAKGEKRQTKVIKSVKDQGLNRARNNNGRRKWQFPKSGGWTG